MECGTMMYGMGMMMWFGFLLGFSLIVLAIMSIVAVVRWLRGDRSPAVTRREHALEILRKRYAQGAIDKDQYENIRKDLE